MNEETIKKLYSGNLGIEYGQFYIDVAEPDEDDYLNPDEAFEKQENGICGSAQSGKIFFVTGIQNGTIVIDVELHSSAPPFDQSFEEIVEVPFQRGKTPVSLCEWACEETHALDLPSGNYRVRYCIDGMGKDYEDDGDWEAPVPNQRHLIQIWNATEAKDKVVKCTSETAAYWHKEWGSKR